MRGLQILQSLISLKLLFYCFANMFSSTARAVTMLFWATAASAALAAIAWAGRTGGVWEATCLKHNETDQIDPSQKKSATKQKVIQFVHIFAHTFTKPYSIQLWCIDVRLYQKIICWYTFWMKLIRNVQQNLPGSATSEQYIARIWNLQFHLYITNCFW